MCISHRRVGYEQLFVSTQRIAELLGAKFEKLISVPVRQWLRNVNLGNHGRFATYGLSCVADKNISVNQRLCDETEHSRCSVATTCHREQLWRLIDHSRRRITGQKGFVGNERNEKWYVCFHPSNPKLLKAPFHSSGRFAKIASAGRYLDKE